MIPSVVIHESEVTGGGGTPDPIEVAIPPRCFIKSVAVIKGTVEVDTLRLYDRNPAAFDANDPANKHLVLAPITTVANDTGDVTLGSAYLWCARNGYPYVSQPAEGDEEGRIWLQFSDTGSDHYYGVRIAYTPAHH